MTAANDHQADALGPTMRLLDLTLPTPAENLALDEALLDEAEDGTASEVLRLWEAEQPMVVIGRSSKIEEEVDREACARLGVPVLRRSSGGAAIVAGPGCLMYAVVLSFDLRPQLQAIDATHQFVLGRLSSALSQLLPDTEHRGTSDLALADRKISGNSLRVKRRHLLYHGTLLYDFPLDLISTCLRTPPRQPDYRQHREHSAFVENVNLEVSKIRVAIAEAFAATEQMSVWPRDRTTTLATEKYATDEWTFSR